MIRHEKRAIVAWLTLLAVIAFAGWLALCWLDYNYPLAAAYCADHVC